MNTMLSIPSTISSTVRVSSAIQVSGLESSSIATGYRLVVMDEARRQRTVSSVSTGRTALPVLGFPAPASAGEPRPPSRPRDARLLEYPPGGAALPSFHVWTLGCQMNRSGPEEGTEER